jgi:hypothetical protein
MSNDVWFKSDGMPAVREGWLATAAFAPFAAAMGIALATGLLSGSVTVAMIAVGGTIYLWLFVRHSSRKGSMWIWHSWDDNESR